MYLFLWCFIYGLKLLKIVTNWYTWEWVRFFSLGFKNLAQRAAKYTSYAKGQHGKVSINGPVNLENKFNKLARYYKKSSLLTLIKMGFLGVRFRVGGFQKGVKLLPLSKTR